MKNGILLFSLLFLAACATNQTLPEFRNLASKREAVFNMSLELAVQQSCKQLKAGFKDVAGAMDVDCQAYPGLGEGEITGQMKVYDSSAYVIVLTYRVLDEEHTGIEMLYRPEPSELKGFLKWVDENDVSTRDEQWVA
ncbi:hypothetical protein [Desulfovibrio oxyclinae]|uniref:hypothetical protein n=1 Tax=Desulfovibrio oxyclinae TaxID=63560 RepID=UPI0003783719|nr:hypothetical protein [Desulfovibrio oxyclinae]